MRTYSRVARWLGRLVDGVMPRAWRALFLMFVLVLASGCGAATQNVRAFRAYANEDPNLKVQIDRVEDIAVTLELVDRILSQTSYTPGDTWPRRLAMTDAEYKARRDDLRDSYPYKNLENVEVPILKCYRYHVENALSEYGPPPEKAKYPSLLDALGALGSRGAQMKAHYMEHQAAIVALAQATEDEKRMQEQLNGLRAPDRAKREGELALARGRTGAALQRLDTTEAQLRADSESLVTDARLSQGEKNTILRDTFYALSVAFRLELEAVALIPIIVVQTVRSLPTAPHDLTYKTNLKIVRQVWQIPSHLAGIKQALARQTLLLDSMTQQFARAVGSSVEKSPGFELSESVVDQIVGITLDSFRVDLRAGADAFVYSSVGTSDRSSANDGKTTYDYRGRAFKLDYRIQPIVLASARLDVTLDWIRLPGAADLSIGYSTDRVYKSGGSIENTSLTQQLGITGVASDIIDAGLGVLGVRSNVRVANFTSGELRQVQATDVKAVVAKAPLQLKYTQVDLGYDILWLLSDDQIRAWSEEIVLGAKYIDYTLPRIVYELRDTATEPGTERFTFFRESPVQPIRTRYYLASASARIGQGDAPRFSPFLDVSIGGGAGPVSYYFLTDGALPDTPSNRTTVDEYAFLLTGSVGAGLRLRLLPRGSRVRLDLRAYYRADFLYSIFNHTSTDGGRALRTDLGAFDIFHTPSLALRGAL